jgi:predicted ATPase
MRNELPSGTVTFLFTDVEGSTKLLHELGAEAYAEALAEHRRVIRDACAAGGGVEVDTQGDAFFFAFPTAPGALAAAGAMTELLARGPIQVRIGLHTGEPLLAEEGYVGDDVHFAARVAGSGHGGQVILSAATAQLVELELSDLGEHRLKDIPEAVPIFQLGSDAFPPLKTISNTNLPRPASSFVGRERETQDVVSLLRDGARLVTLSGPGGTGKTRLSIEAASELVPDFKAGVFWVGLATLRDPGLVTETIAQTLGAKDGLADHIGEREMLLLLDNLEQVIDAAPELGSLLEACPNLKLLVTSRELLRVRGEVEYAVPPLASPEAVELFAARSLLDTDETTAELCRRLDSLPLAVELAAARTSVLTPEQILERLSQRLDMLKGGRDADPRQQTLRATIEWSYELLSPEEQQLLARLSVFAGGCTLEAAEKVAEADLDTLQSLVDKSLVRFTEGRYWMLETIREYATERLEEGGTARELLGGHAAYYLTVVECAAADDSAEHFRRLDVEHDNMRAALTRFREERESEFELRLVSALTPFWVVRGYLREGLSHAEAALASEAGRSPSWRIKVLAAASDFVRMQGDAEQGRAFCEESLALAREIGDDAGVAQALHELGEAASVDGDYDAATEFFQEAIAAGRAAGRNGAGSVGNLGWVAYLQEDYERAMPFFEESVELFRERGHESGVLVGLCNLVDATVLLGRPEEARPRIRECLQLAGELSFVQMIAQSLDATAAVLAESDARTAVRLVGAADVMYEDMNLSPPDADRRVGDRAVESATQLLGAEAARALREDGRRLDREQALELALASID